MNNILFKYLLSGYFKTILKVILIAYCFGVILNLFEEIEFFKNTKATLLLPVTMTALYIPNMMIKLMPFIIFISSMWFLANLRNSKDLLVLKVIGYSNFKIFFILALSSFVFGWLILFSINPITSAMMKYYEQTKSQYSRDVDHLVTINKNGLWIQESLDTGYRIISADEAKNEKLKNVVIFNLNSDYKLIEKITSKSTDITNNKWILNDVIVNKFKDGLNEQVIIKNYSILSKYNYEKIISLFKNFDTMSFLDLVLNYKNLQISGYNKSYLDHNLNSMLSMPFFLFLMTSLASILTLNTLKKSNNFTFFVAGILACVAIYYLKNLSLSLGQTDRISLSLAVWIPIVSIGLFTSIGILQINEK